MTNSLDYIRWRGDITIDKSPVNEVDMSLFCYMSTMNLTDILHDLDEARPFSEIARQYRERNIGAELGVLQPGQLPQMVDLLSQCERFSDLVLSDYESRVNNENNEQFGAVTIQLPDGTFCVSFQGTDDTLVGWKEDCYLAIVDRTSAQEDARSYLERVASRHPGKIRVCGHSKGGNLAVSACVSVSRECRDRIIQVINSDGPGFTEDFLSRAEYLEMRDRITTVLSQHSLIGILMNRPGNVVYVSSCVSGPFAHDMFNWKVLGTCFVRSQGLGSFESRFDKAINGTIGRMSTEEKVLFVDELFNCLECRGASTVTDLRHMKPSDLIQVLMGISKNKSLHSFVYSIIKGLV